MAHQELCGSQSCQYGVLTAADVWAAWHLLWQYLHHIDRQRDPKRACASGRRPMEMAIFAVSEAIVLVNLH